MKIPPAGVWLRVTWRDSDAADHWEEPNEDRPRTIEVSVGRCRGVSEDNKLRLPPTASFRVDTQELFKKMDEFEIPIGCIDRIEVLPPYVFGLEKGKKT